mmetsp:Transcript_25604/g.40203  ORF Transcript_25604/g.40203 Transcript_25604/m.40203 type:complete len:247 (-) Transcript_25604:49-789(-)
MMKMIILSLAAIAHASACMIQNTDSGVCSYKYLTSSQASLDQIEAARERYENDMPFCGKYVNSYPTCVPASSTSPTVPEWLSSDANEDTNAIRAKDTWLEQETAKTIADRIEQERSLGKSHYRYFRNKDCQDAYTAYICWLNFPRCDEFQESMPLCQSACENMFRVCGFEQDLWRCDEDIVDGADEWDMRAFFPGQPFRKNEFERKGEPIAVCTPSIRGSASKSRTSLVIGVGMTGLTLLFLMQCA